MACWLQTVSLRKVMVFTGFHWLQIIMIVTIFDTEVIFSQPNSSCFQFVSLTLKYKFYFPDFPRLRSVPD
jgi:hypothetical protein